MKDSELRKDNFISYIAFFLVRLMFVVLFTVHIIHTISTEIKDIHSHIHKCKVVEIEDE